MNTHEDHLEFRKARPVQHIGESKHISRSSPMGPRMALHICTMNSLT